MRCLAEEEMEAQARRGNPRLPAVMARSSWRWHWEQLAPSCHPQLVVEQLLVKVKGELPDSKMYSSTPKLQRSQAFV